MPVVKLNYREKLHYYLFCERFQRKKITTTTKKKTLPRKKQKKNKQQNKTGTFVLIRTLYCGITFFYPTPIHESHRVQFTYVS